MKGFLILLTILVISSGPGDISRTNKLKKEAETAFSKGDYATAAANYSTLYDSMNVADPAIGLNKAHSYFYLGDSAQAKLAYQNVAASSNDKQLKSIAYQQLGVLSDKPQTLKESLQYFKDALKADPANKQARYNYEVVKKKLAQQQQQNQDQKNKDQQNKEEEKQEPSEFAKQIKAKSDELRKKGLFDQSLDVLLDGLSKDPTVSNYSEIIERLKKVTGRNDQ